MDRLRGGWELLLGFFVLNPTGLGGGVQGFFWFGGLSGRWRDEVTQYSSLVNLLFSRLGLLGYVFSRLPTNFPH